MITLNLFCPVLILVYNANQFFFELQLLLLFLRCAGIKIEKSSFSILRVIVNTVKDEHDVWYWHEIQNKNWQTEIQKYSQQRIRSFALYQAWNSNNNFKRIHHHPSCLIHRSLLLSSSSLLLIFSSSRTASYIWFLLFSYYQIEFRLQHHTLSSQKPWNSCWNERGNLHRTP